MIAVPAGIRVLIAIKPVDFRKGADTLAAVQALNPGALATGSEFPAVLATAPTS